MSFFKINNTEKKVNITFENEIYDTQTSRRILYWKDKWLKIL